MKPITFNQFVSLIQSADLINFDTSDIDSHEVCEDHVMLYWTAEPEGLDGDMQYEVQIDDDKEFFFDSNKGQVKYKDSDGIEVEINFYMKVPLTKIPSDS